MAHLRQSTISTNPSATHPVVNGTGGSQHLPEASGSLPVGPSIAILKGLIETVLHSGGGLQRVRANLYAALLFFMQTAPEPHQTKERGTCYLQIVVVTFDNNNNNFNSQMMMSRKNTCFTVLT